MGELEDVFQCLGPPCVDCFLTIIEDIDESTTCESLAAEEDFCPAVEGCVRECGTNDCTDSVNTLVGCGVKNYPDAAEQSKDLCPGLCEGSEDCE